MCFQLFHSLIFVLYRQFQHYPKERITISCLHDSVINLWLFVILARMQLREMPVLIPISEPLARMRRTQVFDIRAAGEDEKNAGLRYQSRRRRREEPGSSISEPKARTRRTGFFDIRAEGEEEKNRVLRRWDRVRDCMGRSGRSGKNPRLFF
jgi:hypothetical protein